MSLIFCPYQEYSINRWKSRSNCIEFNAKETFCILTQDLAFRSAKQRVVKLLSYSFFPAPLSLKYLFYIITLCIITPKASTIIRCTNILIVFQQIVLLYIFHTYSNKVIFLLKKGLRVALLMLAAIQNPFTTGNVSNNLILFLKICKLLQGF